MHHMIFMYGTHVKKDNISKFISHFFQILIFGVSRGWKGKKWRKMTKNCRTPYLRKHHMVVILGTHVYNENQHFDFPCR